MRDFRAGRRDFFLTTRPGPKSAPAKEAARARIVALRQAGHSIDEIAEALAAEGSPVRLARRAYSPVLRSADIPEVKVPWWGGRRLRFEYA